MADGGFIIKFNGKVIERCYSCKFDYDEWKYTMNNKSERPLPEKLRKIEIVVEKI